MELSLNGVPVLLAQAEGEHAETEEHNPVLPEADELIFGGLAFTVVFLVLALFAYPRLKRAMEERREKIQGDLEGAERARTDAQSELERYREQLREARGEAGSIIEEGRKTAESMRRDMLARAEEESNQIVARAQEEIRAERDRAFQELRRQVGEISVELATRVVGESLDRERQMRLVDSYIDEVAGMSSNGGNGGGRGAAPGGGTAAPGETGPTAAGRPGAPQRDEPGFGMGYPPRPGEAEGGTSGQRPEEPGG